MNRDRLLADAKAKALALADGYTPPEPRELRLPGPTGRAALELAARQARAGRPGRTPHDLVVLGALAERADRRRRRHHPSRWPRTRLLTLERAAGSRC